MALPEPGTHAIAMLGSSYADGRWWCGEARPRLVKVLSGPRRRQTNMYRWATVKVHVVGEDRPRRVAVERIDPAEWER